MLVSVLSTLLTLGISTVAMLGLKTAALKALSWAATGSAASLQHWALQSKAYGHPRAAGMGNGGYLGFSNGYICCRISGRRI